MESSNWFVGLRLVSSLRLLFVLGRVTFVFVTGDGVVELNIRNKLVGIINNKRVRKLLRYIGVGGYVGVWPGGVGGICWLGVIP